MCGDGYQVTPKGGSHPRDASPALDNYYEIVVSTSIRILSITQHNFDKIPPTSLWLIRTAS